MPSPRKVSGMTAPVLEHVLLDVLPGQTEAFEAAFVVARPLIEAQRGFVQLELRRCIEYPARYLLLVTWDSLEAHTIGFRQSPEYDQWRALLHHFYDPMPEVTHYEALG
jgi:heme-degrading monooxygenase HmoA